MRMQNKICMIKLLKFYALDISVVKLNQRLR